jgi:hypothetical protein
MGVGEDESVYFGRVKWEMLVTGVTFFAAALIQAAV